MKSGREAEVHEHWFGLGDCCISVTEFSPSMASRGSLFFLHGRLGQAEMWDPVIRSLSRSFHCLMMSLPGFGTSYSVRNRVPGFPELADIVSRVIDHFNQGPAVVVGHDVGGAVAQLCTFRDPMKVAGLVLINSACLSRPLSRFPLALDGALLRWKLQRELKSILGIPECEKRLLLEPLRSRKSRRFFLHTLESIQDNWPMPEEQAFWKRYLTTVAQPVLLLWGARDVFNPAEIGSEMMRRLPEAYYFENEDCGHWPCMEKTSWVVTKVREFMFKMIEGRAKRAIGGRRSLSR
jgi:haloalkane dehalogenase